MRNVIVTTGSLITQGAARSTACEVLPFPEGRPSRCDARPGHGRSAPFSGLVGATLTDRERDILAMISQGLSNKRIARAREISPETVKSHLKRIFLKLAVSTRAQAIWVAASRSDFLRVAAILSSAIIANGYAGPVSADPTQASAENTVVRCQQLFDLWSRHNTDSYARPLDARMGLEDCRKGNVASGIATLKRALERAQIPIPPAESGVAQTPVPLKPHGEKRRFSQ